MGKFLQFLMEMNVKGQMEPGYRGYIRFDIDKNNIEIKPQGSSFYDKQNNIIFLNDKDLALDNWAKTRFGDKNYIREIVKNLVKYFNIIDANVHIGRNFNSKVGNDTYYSTVKDLLGSKENLGGKTLTLYHGTSSIYLEHIQKYGLRSLQSTGITQFNTTGRYYPNQNPVYLTTIPNRAWEYANMAHKNNPKGEPIILKVVLPILGNESHFWADDDWLDLQEGDKNSLRKEWRRSLKETGQIVYLGRIPASEVELYFPKEIKPIKDITFEKIEKYSDINYIDLIDTAISNGVDYSKICNVMNGLVGDSGASSSIVGDDGYEMSMSEALEKNEEGAAEEAASFKQEDLEYNVEREQIKPIDDNYEFDSFDELYNIIENDKIDETWEDVSEKDKEKMISWYQYVSYEIKQFINARTELFS